METNIFRIMESNHYLVLQNLRHSGTTYPKNTVIPAGLSEINYTELEKSGILSPVSLMNPPKYEEPTTPVENISQEFTEPMENVEESVSTQNKAKTRKPNNKASNNPIGGLENL